MLFDIPFVADWQNIGEHRQRLTDLTPPVKTKAGLIMIISLSVNTQYIEYLHNKIQLEL
jgi:hypothetical protein